MDVKEICMLGGRVRVRFSDYKHQECYLDLMVPLSELKRLSGTPLENDLLSQPLGAIEVSALRYARAVIDAQIQAIEDHTRDSGYD